MATETQSELLDVVDLLQAPTNENAEAPTFDNPPLDESPPTGIVAMAKRTFTKSSTVVEMLKSNENPEQSIEAQYFAAIKFASQLPKDVQLETFNDAHQEYAAALINVFYRIQVQNLKRAVQYAQTVINPSLLNYALSVALIHRDDAVEANIQLPSHVVTNPSMYFDMGKVSSDFANGVNTQTPNIDGNSEIKPRYVEINATFSGTNKDPEHKVAYFREDIGLNLHHRHWHEVYPFIADESIINKDRRGELFYYMHQQILARYNFERLCNGLSRVKPYADFREPIEEAYFPKLDSMSKSSAFSSRPVNTMLKDLHRDQYYIKLSTLERWRERIYDAIDRGYAYTINKETQEEVLKKIDPVTGINELANSVEAVQKLSWNFRYYGNLHNRGHFFIAYVHDPDNRFKEKGSVMSHAETALRDPIFYRWHAFLDEIFQHYKRTLPSYTLEERQFRGITIDSVKIESQGDESQVISEIENQKSDLTSNVLTTFWEKDSVDVTQGILNKDPTKDKIYAVFTHLQHKEFQYVIEVTNELPETITGTVRIFLAPLADESGLPMTFNGQRKMFIEMDKFTHQLDPGKNTITRKSIESSVTIPFEKSFMTLTDVRKLVDDPELNKSLNKAINGYCGCGWPQHLLVGKGTPGEGFKCQLFVMITNYEEDKVEESLLTQKCCDKSSLSYCGVRNKKYPDKKPMGFPFDRDIPDMNATIFEFMTEKQKHFDREHFKDGFNNGPQLSNMIVVPVRVRHVEGHLKCGKSMKNTGYILDEENKKNISA